MAYLRNSTRNMMSRITRITTTIAPTAPPATAAIEETRGIEQLWVSVCLFSSTPLTSNHDTMCSGPTLPGHLTTVGTSYFTGALSIVQTNGAHTSWHIESVHAWFRNITAWSSPPSQSIAAIVVLSSAAGGEFSTTGEDRWSNVRQWQGRAVGDNSWSTTQRNHWWLGKNRKSKNMLCVCQLVLQLHTGACPDHTPLVPFVVAPQVLISLPTSMYPVLQV